MQMDSHRNSMKRTEKGKRPIIRNDRGEDDELDIDNILESIHCRMLEEREYPAPELNIPGSDRTPQLVADERWRRLGRRDEMVGKKLDATASCFYMQPKPLRGIRNEVRLTGFGQPQTNSNHSIQQDLSSAFSGMNMSGIKGSTNEENHQRFSKPKDLGNNFHLLGDKHDMQHAYLNNYAKTIIEGSSPTAIKNASFRNQYQNMGSSSSSPYIPLFQRDGGDFSSSLARAIELRNLYEAQTHIRDQLFLQHVASIVGEPQVPAFNQNYLMRPVYGPALQNPQRPLDGLIVPKYPDRSTNPVSRGVLGSGNLIFTGNMEESDISSVIPELQNNISKTLRLTDVAGHFVQLSKDQYGSRFIQMKLATASPEEMHTFFHEIRPLALTLMVDVFGNYVIQKLLDYGNKYQIRELARQMTGHVYQLSIGMFSCRVVQKALEVIEVGKRITLVSELEGHVLELIRDQNGNHVIQKCIEQVPEESIHFILSAILEQIVPLSNHAYGCRVIQRVLENCHSKKTQKILTDEISQYVTFLADDMYGNYVVQCVLEKGQPQVRSNIIKNLTGQIVHMSTLKYASNVVEKCLTFGTVEERKILVDEMLHFSHDCDALQLLINDQFGNYVVQRGLEICNDDQLEQILNRIKVHMCALPMHCYAKNVLLRLEKLIIAGERRHHILNSAEAVPKD